MNTHTTVNIGKRALVTGASSGIGAAIAREPCFTIQYRGAGIANVPSSSGSTFL